jgi:hypothetical protein
MNKDITNATLLMIAELAGEHTMPDGRKVQITVLEQASTETELSAKFEDCFMRVEPTHYISGYNTATKTTSSDYNNEAHHNQVPTERNAKQLQAFAKLLVIMHDLNSGEWVSKDEESIYKLVYLRETDDFYTRKATLTNESPIYFRTSELAQKALEANEQIFRDFYGI